LTLNGSIWGNNGFDQLAPLFAVTVAGTVPWNNYDHPVPPPAMFQVQPTPYQTTCNSALAATSHTVMNVAFADGHVGSLSGSVSPTAVWWPLLTPAAGDIPADY
jgi:prepilin-type processing-associated H-X9-DG protein